MFNSVGFAVPAACAALVLGWTGRAHADPPVDYFQTPSGNIACMLGGFDGGVACDIAQHTYAAPPRPADCGPTNFGDRIQLLPGQYADDALPRRHGEKSRSRADTGLWPAGVVGSDHLCERVRRDDVSRFGHRAFLSARARLLSRFSEFRAMQVTIDPRRLDAVLFVLGRGRAEGVADLLGADWRASVSASRSCRRLTRDLSRLLNGWQPGPADAR